MQQLRFLDALDRTRSLSAAARGLGLTQPALTKALQDLELAVGQELFERHPQGVRATAAGEALVRFARRTLADLDRVGDELNEIIRPGGGLAVLGALPVAAAGLLPDIILRARARFPDLRLRIVEVRGEDLTAQLRSGELDAIIGRLYRPEVPDGFKREVLYDEPISLIARSGHPLFELPEAERSEKARDYDLLLPTFTQRIGREIEHLLGAWGLQASPHSLRTTSHLFLREMLHQSDLVTVAPRTLVAGDLMRGTLSVVPTHDPTPSRPAGLVTRLDRPASPSLRLLLQVVRESIADMLEHHHVAITKPYGQAVRSDGRSEAAVDYDVHTSSADAEQEQQR